MRLSQTRTTNSIAMVSAADPTRSALRTRFDATNDSYSRLTVTSHVVRRDGGQIVATLPLAEVEACHEQVTGRNDPYPSAFLEERKHITSRVGRHLRRRDSPPLEAHLDHGVEWEPQSHLKGVNRQPKDTCRTVLHVMCYTRSWR
ncbi:hypothetical protein GW17_00035111 [Ensete ventricosum]|nr:hypothetical protein GW17_00035111 [Ensete ventricosum]